MKNIENKNTNYELIGKVINDIYLDMKRYYGTPEKWKKQQLLDFISEIENLVKKYGK